MLYKHGNTVRRISLDGIIKMKTNLKIKVVIEITPILLALIELVIIVYILQNL